MNRLVGGAHGLTGMHAATVDKVASADADDALTGEFTWTVDNFSRVKQLKLYSPVFQSGQYNWCAANFDNALSSSCYILTR